MVAGGGEGKRPRIILVPFPAQGHVTPMLHLALALYARGFAPTLATLDFIHGRLVARRDPADTRVRLEPIPTGLAAHDDVPRDFAAIFGAMEGRAAAAGLERVLKAASPEPISFVVVDLLASWAITVAEQCGRPVVGFWPAMLASYRLISAIPELMERGFISDCGTPLHQCSHYHHLEDNKDHVAWELQLSGQAKLRTKDLPWLVGSPSSQRLRFAFWLQTVARANRLRWLLVNSFPGEEGGPNEDPLPIPLQPSKHSTSPEIFQVGPLLAGNKKDGVDHSSMWDEDWTCVEWLAKQAPESVVYVSFGSWVGPIGPERIRAFALGLEATRRPFLWVLKDDEAWRAGLPGRYVDRVADRGRVVRWAPQEEVLRCPAVGCFLTHCGWNSTVEAIKHGKRLLCYPISGDQFLNCEYIVKVWGIGVELDGASVSAVQDGVRRIMLGKEGAEAQARVLELRKQVLAKGGECSGAMADLRRFVDAIRKIS